MAKKIIKAQMKQRRDTLENWAAANPVLLDGELGFIEGFNDRFKVGDGKTAWNDLSYFSGSFNPAGTYPNLTAGDLAGRGESVPAEFSFRASGGKSIKDGRAYIKRIKGNSVVWNQMFKERKGIVSELNGLTIVNNNDGSYTISGKNNSSSDVRIVLSDYFSNRVGDIYLLTGGPKGGSTSTYRLEEGYSGAFDQGNGRIGKYATSNHDSSALSAVISANYEITSPLTFRPRTTNLTKMFGAGYEPSTIEEFYARVATLGIDLNAYNEGQVIHCNTESIKSVGDNAWDEQWEVGSIYTTTGADKPSTSTIRTKNPIKILPNTEYFKFCGNTNASFYWHIYYDSEMNFIETKGVGYNMKFITPINAHYMKTFAEDAYGTTYKNDLTISLYHSGWKAEVDNVYKPYWQDILPLPIIRKYFPNGMKLADTAHDEIRFNKASGKLEAIQRLGGVDMGKLSWNYGQPSDNYPYGYFYKTIDEKEYGHNLLCAKYTSARSAIPFSIDKNIFGANGNKIVYIIDSAYTDAASLKASLQGVMLYYELAEPIVTEITEDFRDYYNVADFGTEEAIPATDAEGNIIPSAAFSADIIYQFNAVDQIRENYNEIQELKNQIATMQAQLTSLINK